MKMISILFLVCLFSGVKASENEVLTPAEVKEGFTSIKTHKTDGRVILVRDNGYYSYRDEFSRGRICTTCKNCRDNTPPPVRAEIIGK